MADGPALLSATPAGPPDASSTYDASRRAFHVVHMSSVHPASDTRIFAKECRSLAAAGFDVSYVVPHHESTVIDGVRIHAVPKPASRLGRMSRTAYQVLSAALDLDADLYHFHDPELIPAGLLLKARGKRVVYDAHENLPGDILHSKAYMPRWMRPWMAAGAHGIESIGAAAFDGIVTITDGFAKRFPAKKTCVVSNYPVVTGNRTDGLAPHASRKPLVVFTGGLAVERCAREVVDGVGLVAARSPVHLAVAGLLESQALLDELHARPHGDVLEYVGWVTHAQVAALLSTARVALVMSALRPDFDDISTNKLYEYMLYGLPVVASPIPSWRTEIETHRCGIVLSGNTPEAVAGGVQWLLDHPDDAEAMGRRGAAAVHTTFNWATQAARLVSFYDRLLADDPSPAVVGPSAPA